MKKKLALMIAALAVAFSLALPVAKPKPAECAWCYVSTCYYAGACGNDCHCIKRGMDTSGTCYSISKDIPVGYEVLK